MDSLTHTVLGMCAGEALAGKKLGKKAMLYGAIANNVPDIDVVTSWWMNPADSLLAHRGFTHSILFGIVFTILMSWLLRNRYKEKDFHFRDWIILIGSGIVLHIGLDSLTSYGTGWFEPFSHYRVSFNTIFVADPLFTIALLAAAIALLILKRSSGKRALWTKMGLIISSAYLLFTLVNKIYVNNVVQKSMTAQHIPDNNWMATPTPLNNFLWYILAKDSTGFHIGYYSDFDKRDEISFTFIPENDSLTAVVSSDIDVKKLMRFSQGYYLIEEKNDTLSFNDMRFGQTGNWKDGNTAFVFNYGLAKDADNNMVVQRGRFRGSGKEMLKNLWERIKGI